MKKLLLLLTICTALCYGQFPYEVPCRLTPNPGPSIGNTMTIHTNKDCAEGSVFWNYPEGNLRVVFERRSSSDAFEVCLTKDGGSYNLNRIIDVRTGNLIPKPIGSDECVRSKDGRVVLEFQSDRLLYYLAIIIYKIQ
ncbi:uncharacterized protein LOC135467214 [Liolophura sinensis]|uniref:uncharacterized protein LOC135467214 n=1 Tax=Liolophura sinensis TaxID=3198878 RepID=UPI003158BDFE